MNGRKEGLVGFEAVLIPALSGPDGIGGDELGDQLANGCPKRV
jgi:hypothetical protein